MKHALPLLIMTLIAPVLAAEAPVLNLWPATPPGDEKVKLEAEKDLTKPTDALIAGRKIIKLGNVSTPSITIYRPAPEKDTGASVVICPGGGHYILAWDLEGTEVAEWLNTLGVTGIVLKYRVPARDPKARHVAAVQDAQRAVSLVRSRAAEWKLDPKRIGILGFSAGGEVAALTALYDQRLYTAIDDIDKVSARPDFAVLVYPAYIEQKDQGKLREDIKVTKETPPMFFVHAADDRISSLNSLLLAAELKKAGVPAEAHIYTQGGHGYGLRRTDKPVTSWPDRCGEWMRSSKLLEKP